MLQTTRKPGADPIFRVGRLQRLPLGTPYPGVIRHVMAMHEEPHLQRAEIVIDYTGVGRPCFDLFKAKGVNPLVGVSITAGDDIIRDGAVWRVPKKVLVSGLQALLHDGRLKIHKDLPETPALIDELEDFRAEVTDSGYWKFGARSGKHDDLVLALAIAVWRANNARRPMWIPPEMLAEAAKPGGFGTGSPFGFGRDRRHLKAYED